MLSRLGLSLSRSGRLISQSMAGPLRQRASRQQMQMLKRSCRQQFHSSRGQSKYPGSNTVNAAKQQAERTWLVQTWISPTGIRTVHFWAPIMKWGLVLAGVSDFFRPVERLSFPQNLALMVTGALWMRWCFVIHPQNVLLAGVNFFLACVGSVQVTRSLVYIFTKETGPEEDEQKLDEQDKKE